MNEVVETCITICAIVCVICLRFCVGLGYEYSKTNQCRKILNESAYHLTHLQVEYYEQNCENN